MNKIGYVYDELMLLHEHYDHLECPERIIVIHDELKKRSYLDKMIKIDSQKITQDGLLLVHSQEYIDHIYNIFKLPEKQIKIAVNKMDSLYANKNSLISAEVAAGSTLNLMVNILNGVIDHGVAIVRPPGHHCARSSASGFCFLNNAAIAAKYALNNEKRVAVVDWDVKYECPRA
jgi:histone deacetylase 6